MSKIDDGGPVYPCAREVWRRDDMGRPIGPPAVLPHEGISLRDYFAGQAMMGSLPDLGSDGWGDANAVAKAAYAMADAMLAARAAKKEAE